VTIDTLEYVKKLEAAGVDRRQAEAHAAAVRDTVATQLASKADLDAAVVRLEAKIDRLEAKTDRIEQRFDGKFLLLQWMLGFNLLLTAGVLWRLLR
jgi:predicted RNase H-like nuclease (RuvC/YqgF family)